MGTQRAETRIRGVYKENEASNWNSQFLRPGIPTWDAIPSLFLAARVPGSAHQPPSFRSRRASASVPRNSPINCGTRPHAPRPRASTLHSLPSSTHNHHAAFREGRSRSGRRDCGERVGGSSWRRPARPPRPPAPVMRPILLPPDPHTTPARRRPRAQPAARPDLGDTAARTRRARRGSACTPPRAAARAHHPAR